jgi:tetratricopeptide (TPR) repeat protein
MPSVLPSATITDFLNRALASGSLAVGELEAKARAAGLLGERQQIHHAKAFKKAKKALGIRSIRDRFRSGGSVPPANEPRVAPEAELDGQARPVPVVNASDKHAAASKLAVFASSRCPRAIATNTRAATRVDPTFADAWYNLSDLLDEQGRSEAAIECLRTALRAAPDYADAMSRRDRDVPAGCAAKIQIGVPALSRDVQPPFYIADLKCLILRNDFVAVATKNPICCGRRLLAPLSQ